MWSLKRCFFIKINEQNSQINPPHANYARKGMKEIFLRVITRMNDEQLERREYLLDNEEKVIEAKKN